MKYIKRILLVLFILVVVITAAVFILLRFYKKEMASLLIDYLKTEYSLTLKVEDAEVSLFTNWPHASVELKNVYLASDLYPDKKEPLLKAGSLSLSLNLSKLLQKQFIVNSVSLRNAEILLVKNADGSKNFVFKTDSVKPVSNTSGSALVFEVNKVSIKNTNFSFINREKKQHIELRFLDNNVRLHHASDGFTAKLSGRISTPGLVFNETKGAFLKNVTAKTNIDVSVYFKSKMVVVHPSSYLSIDNHRYHCSSWVQLGEKKQLMLRIESREVDYQKAAILLTPRIEDVLNNFTVEKPLDIDALVIAQLGAKEEPVLIVNFGLKNNNVKIGNSRIPYSDVSLKGTLVSLDSSGLRGNAEQGRLVFRSVKGKLYDYPFTASVSINSLVDPNIDLDARLLVEARKIKFKVAQDFVLKGSCVALVKYSGPTKKLNKDEFLGEAMRLNADLIFKNFSYQEKDKPYTYLVRGKAGVNNRDLKFENLLFETDAGEARLSGKAEGFVPYVLGYGNKVKVTLKGESDYLNLNAYLPGKTAARQKSDSLEKDNKKTKAEYKQNLQENESSFEFFVTLLVKKLYIRKVEALNASIELSHKNKLLTIKSIKANTCDGKIALKGSIYDLRRINAEMDMENINIARLFDEFENFGQKKVESRHLKGSISMHSVFKTDLDDKMEIVGESMTGEVKLRLKDGHLLNFEPVQSMSNFIFKNRDFDNVSFSELNERFRIRGYEMDIQELEIGSNILNLFVTGIYNFKESSNINILIPWNNLKKRGKNYIPKSSGETAENSKGLKLNFSGPTNNMKLTLGHKEISR